MGRAVRDWGLGNRKYPTSAVLILHSALDLLLAPFARGGRGGRGTLSKDAYSPGVRVVVPAPKLLSSILAQTTISRGITKGAQFDFPFPTPQSPASSPPSQGGAGGVGSLCPKMLNRQV